MAKTASWKQGARAAALMLKRAVKTESDEEAGAWIDGASARMHDVVEEFWDLAETRTEGRYSDPNYAEPDEPDDILATSQVHLPPRAWRRLYLRAKRDGVDIHTALARLLLPEESYTPPEFPTPLVPSGGQIQ